MKPYENTRVWRKGQRAAWKGIPVKLRDLNPDVYAQLDALRTDMRQTALDRELAKTALHETSRRHRVGTLDARKRHARRPRATLV